jgi:hypothetical protein
MWRRWWCAAVLVRWTGLADRVELQFSVVGGMRGRVWLRVWRSSGRRSCSASTKDSVRVGVGISDGLELPLLRGS